jgi:20S proteasome subunit alpha 7
MTWISGLDGPTKGRHQHVPQDLLDEAEKAAKKSLEGDDEDEEEAEDEMQE